MLGPFQGLGRNNLFFTVYGEQIKATWKNGQEEMENKTQNWDREPKEQFVLCQLCPEIT